MDEESELFLVRVWAEPVKIRRIMEQEGVDLPGQEHWHGKVQHVLSGKAASFNDWPTLVELLTKMVPPNPSANLPITTQSEDVEQREE